MQRRLSRASNLPRRSRNLKLERTLWQQFLGVRPVSPVIAGKPFSFARIADTLRRHFAVPKTERGVREQICGQSRCGIVSCARPITAEKILRCLRIKFPLDDRARE